jgi:hypothetical protein
MPLQLQQLPMAEELQPVVVAEYFLVMQTNQL